jgi:hypothetical protein
VALWDDVPEEVALDDLAPGIERLAGDPGEEEEAKPKWKEAEESTAAFGGLDQAEDDGDEEG